MRVLVVGGSGLIGSHVVDVLRERGHAVTTAARGARPGVDHVLDIESATVDELRPLLAGLDGVVYSARADEQRVLPKPIYPAVHAELVEPVVRVFTAARAEGLSRGVIMGSYYTYFNRLHPDWRLTDRHTYIRCRVEQAELGRAAAGPHLPVSVLELPFVFGSGGGRLPTWAAPLDGWVRSRAPLAVPVGGTAATSARHVGEVAVEALQQAAGADIPVADENLTWADMITRIATSAGRSRPVRRLPAAVLRAATRAGSVRQSLGGKQSGLNPRYVADLLLDELFVESPSGRSLEQAMRDTFGGKATVR